MSGASSLRLESYLFTEQAFEAARDAPRPGGVFAMYNYYRETWLVDRLANTAQQVFGHAPCIDVPSARRQRRHRRRARPAPTSTCGADAGRERRAPPAAAPPVTTGRSST